MRSRGFALPPLSLESAMETSRPRNRWGVASPNCGLILDPGIASILGKTEILWSSFLAAAPSNASKTTLKRLRLFGGNTRSKSGRNNASHQTIYRDDL